jgi:methylenetetrahydrofolate reductase (NADPH)
MHGLTLPTLARSTFVVSIEVLPPRGHDVSGTVKALSTLPPGAAHFFNVADSPMARPRMSPTVLAGILQAATGLDAIVHLTVRDRNRVALESEILGAKALNIHHQLAVSGDSVEFCDRGQARAARDLQVPDLVHLCSAMGQTVGAVFDVSLSLRAKELRKMERKVQEGASFIITQPVFSEDRAAQVASDLKQYAIPVLMGILPLYSTRHTEFLQEHVPGILIPASIREQMRAAASPVSEGAGIARGLLQIAKGHFQGVCIMPPFGRYELAAEILEP